MNFQLYIQFSTMAVSWLSRSDACKLKKKKVGGEFKLIENSCEWYSLHISREQLSLSCKQLGSAVTHYVCKGIRDGVPVLVFICGYFLGLKSSVV